MTLTEKSFAINDRSRDERYWRSRLAAACNYVHIHEACFALIDNGATVIAGYGHSTEDIFISKTQPALCVAKLFTATVVASLVTRGRLNFEDAVVDVLAPLMATTPVIKNMLSGVTISHLLSHSHGLDTLELDSAPLDDKGFIDAAAVVAGLTHSGKICAPGRFFSYGVTGFILLGMIIESVTRQPYTLAVSELLAKKGPDCRSLCIDAGSAICPASGAGLNLALEDLLHFLKFFIPPLNEGRLSQTVINKTFSQHQAVPGWSPTITGCGLGWKCFDDGWFGQDGMDGRHLMYVRVNHRAGTAICLLAQSARRNPGVLPPLLLQHDYPALGFSKKQKPGISQNAHESYSTVTGTYGNRAARFIIRLMDGRLTLEIIAVTKTRDAHTHRCHLFAADNNIYFLSKPWQYITFLQLISDDGAERYLWDHTQMWRELAA